MIPHEYLEDCAQTYHEKHKIYGDNFLIIGQAMAAIFPEGLTVKTANDWNRLHLMLLNMVKVTRYANNYNKGGHEDSLRDSIVYNAMLQYVDEEIQKQNFKNLQEKENSHSAVFKGD